MRMLQHITLTSILMFLLLPILLFQSQYVLANLVTELPILVLINIVLLIFFLEDEVRQFQHRSVFLLVIAAVSVFSSFFRIIPLPMGITLAFLIPICSGVIFGCSFGFLIGQLSMLVGGLFLGALGPWTPYQSFLMGAVGYYAGLLFHRKEGSQTSLVAVLIYALVASFVYGYLMSVSQWTVVVQSVNVSPNWWDRMKMYSGFYMITSFIWDSTRAVGNVIVFCLLYKTTCELLVRAKNRLTHYR